MHASPSQYGLKYSGFKVVPQILYNHGRPQDKNGGVTH
jgi:hypothetical protein